MLRILFRILLLTILAFLLAILCYQLSGNSIETAYHRLAIKLNYKTYIIPTSLKNIDTLKLNAIDMNIDIKSTPDALGKITFTTGVGHNSNLITQINNHTLIASVKDINEYDDSTLTIDIPSSVKNIIISTIHGNINLHQINIDKLQCTTSVGNLNAAGNIKSIEFTSSTSNISINTTYAVPIYKIQTLTGNIDLQLPENLNAKIDVHSKLGQVSVIGVPHQVDENAGLCNAPR